jgi:hypothetical protein
MVAGIIWMPINGIVCLVDLICLVQGLCTSRSGHGGQSWA